MFKPCMTLTKEDIGYMLMNPKLSLKKKKELERLQAKEEEGEIHLCVKK